MNPMKKTDELVLVKSASRRSDRPGSVPQPPPRLPWPIWETGETPEYIGGGLRFLLDRNGRRTGR